MLAGRGCEVASAGQGRDAPRARRPRPRPVAAVGRGRDAGRGPRRKRASRVWGATKRASRVRGATLLRRGSQPRICHASVASRFAGTLSLLRAAGGQILHLQLGGATFAFFPVPSSPAPRRLRVCDRGHRRRQPAQLASSVRHLRVVFSSGGSPSPPSTCRAPPPRAPSGFPERRPYPDPHVDASQDPHGLGGRRCRLGCHLRRQLNATEDAPQHLHLLPPPTILLRPGPQARSV